MERIRGRGGDGGSVAGDGHIFAFNRVGMGNSRELFDGNGLDSAQGVANPSPEGAMLASAIVS